MSRRTIYFVVGDIGSAKEMVPAAQELLRRGHEVRWVADGFGKAGSDVLLKQGILFEETPFVPDRCDAIVAGTSATAANLQILWTSVGRTRGIPVLWVEDLWGTGERPRTREVDPDVMITIDEVAADIARSVRPGLRTIAVGKPSFENLPSLAARRDETRAHVFDELGIRDDALLATYWSGGEFVPRVFEHLEEFGAVLRTITRESTRPIIIAPRLHPKLPVAAKEAFQRWMDIMRYVPGIVEYTPKNRVIDAQRISQDDLNVASNLVIADWGCTEGYRSMLLGIPTIVTMFPDDRERRELAGYPDGVPPMLRAQAAWDASTPDMLRYLVTQVFLHENEMREYTREHRAPFMKLMEPGAAGRIADAVLAEIL